MNTFKPNVAVFIDADNISAASARNIFDVVCKIGSPIIRRAYGTPQCFQSENGWQLAQREWGISSCPQISNLKGKNAADIALVIDAVECLYRYPCEAIFIVSNDSDYTALAKKIRENGKAVYGLGGDKAPISFRSACTQYVVLPKPPKAKSEQKPAPLCPRCGAVLQVAWTKSHQRCQSCPTCGGMSGKLSLLRSAVAEESLKAIIDQAAMHEQPGCVCPDCNSQMSIIRVSSGKRAIEIDVCSECRTVWYDQNEFALLAPTDGLLSATVSAGKAFRREVLTQLAADLRAHRIQPKTIGALKSLLKRIYHVPTPDIQAVVGTLCCQKVMTISKTGDLSLCTG
ncbi:MAG: NYN domain-containing protein [Kiritimatiellia bacterium]